MDSDDKRGPGAASASLEEQAASALIRAKSGEWTAGDDEKLTAWLTDPAHARAFHTVRRAWRAVGTHSASPELIALRRDALRRDHVLRRPWAIAALVVLGAAGLWLGLASFGRTGYRTGIGEQRVVELTDRSRIALDAATSLRVRMTRDARVVKLLEGQAQFMVAHDPRRPFLVEVGAETITAVGTSFNVEYLDKRLKIDMVDGRVTVALTAPTPAPTPAPAAGAGAAANAGQGASAGGPLRPLRTDRMLDLAAGEELNVGPGGQPRVLHNADIDAAIAWRQGKIIFKNTPLGDAVRQLNRYSSLQLQIGDASLAAERISGVFDLGDTVVFAEAVQSSLPAIARRAGPNLLVLASAP
jgi:transmembrane sensor